MWLDVVGFLIAVAFGAWVAFPSARRRRQFGNQFARRNLAFIDSGFVPYFDRAATYVDRLVGIAFVSGFGLLLLLSEGPLRSVTVETLEATLVGIAVVAWGGLRLHLAGREFPVSRGRAVIARPTRTMPSDYVSLPVRLMTLFVAMSTAALGIVVAVAWRDDSVRTTDAICIISGAVVTVVVAFLVEGFSRVMCERAQPAVDACHLYFQDAWRGEALQQAHLGVLMCGWLVFMGAYAADMALDWSKPYPLATFAVGGSQLVLIFVSRLRFRSRLWPGLEVGQVLLPGQPAPARAGALA